MATLRALPPAIAALVPTNSSLSAGERLALWAILLAPLFSFGLRLALPPGTAESFSVFHLLSPEVLGSFRRFLFAVVSGDYFFSRFTYDDINLFLVHVSTFTLVVTVMVIVSPPIRFDARKRPGRTGRRRSTHTSKRAAQHSYLLHIYSIPAVAYCMLQYFSMAISTTHILNRWVLQRNAQKIIDARVSSPLDNWYDFRYNLGIFVTLLVLYAPLQLVLYDLIIRVGSAVSYLNDITHPRESLGASEGFWVECDEMEDGGAGHPSTAWDRCLNHIDRQRAVYRLYINQSTFKYAPSPILSPTKGILKQSTQTRRRASRVHWADQDNGEQLSEYQHFRFSLWLLSLDDVDGAEDIGRVLKRYYLDTKDAVVQGAIAKAKKANLHKEVDTKTETDLVLEQLTAIP